ncbi:MAG TPA: sodium-dependent transporter [Micropepsaceae bacterium]|nr:sodium-dependent transporter [Micropepsaceae bacterium]
MSDTRITWSGRMAFMLATVGSAVGLGSIWKFPYMVGENGGSAFLLVYLAGLVVLILPLMLAEFVVGRRGGGSAVGSIRAVARESGASPAWSVVGGWGVLTGFLILSFYAVIGGWTLAYIPISASDAFAGASPDAIGGIFGALLSDPDRLILWQGVFMALAIGTVAMGVISGIERMVTLLMPLMFVLLAGLVVYAVSTGDAAATFDFFFAPDFSKVTWEVALDAIGLGFFSIGVGIGVMITYAAYADRAISLTQAAIWTILADTFASFLAAFAIFPIVFGFGLDPAGGAGLMFTTLPAAFGQMGAGAIVGTAFFVLLAVSALASAISLLELPVSWAVERFRVARALAALVIGGACFAVGLGTVWSFNRWADWHPLSIIPAFEGKTFFDALDFLTSNIMLPAGGIAIALFAGFFVARKVMGDELGIKSTATLGLLRFLLAVVAPLAILAIVAVTLAQGGGGE